MTERSTEHTTFVIERSYPASPARAFAAWADPVQKARWFVGPDEWIKFTHETDFRVGGHERLSTGPAGVLLITAAIRTSCPTSASSTATSCTWTTRRCRSR